ncbi:hypothetical protein F3K25_27485 [Klebsiella pneumoniae]|nr:hypothetical protein [Klebsiella pneumoniae]
MRDLILQLSKSSIYSTKPLSAATSRVMLQTNNAVYRILAAPTPLYYETKLAHLSKYYIRCSVFLHQITSWFLCYLSSSERLFSNAFPCASSR